ncbi:MAG: purine-binding chemotaxis protein CheW [Gammaproteobacteria bacterium]|nr:purine-binding chemotaxis protein CheW [Gammaproteobacteria bacterium]
MLFLRFNLGESRYALATHDVVEIVPGIRLTKLPTAPDYVAGLFNYRGRSVPVIDVSCLLLKKNSIRRLSTRVVLVTVRHAAGSDQVLGLLVEQATETVKLDEKLFVRAGIQTPEALCLGPVFPDAEGLITRLTPQVIFEHMDESLLFPASNHT